ncbi:LacI family DNA-binding transcriptional regulator [Niabella ginsengisoli]|uniref:Substrate-binding domain-containing protein n=1 Tax=Niabella ginsengisoli TaxID=522298 RepID=A0ABS9SKV3_9BACT|nr:substrate-binding domain-containing protein [Niabella ginsengisoli]MCH5598931.1 substrate-binding domain-containing protein [Niabella ginsengisoli]
MSSETRDTAHISNLKSKNIPVVFFDRELEGYEAPKVVTNDYECGELAARHLLEKGCKFPVFLSTSDALAICQNRFSGFANVVGKIQNKIATNPFVINCSNDRDIYDQIVSILDKLPGIDGIVASVEKLAIQTLLVCAEKGIAIPERIKVLAFSTLETAPLLNPSLTTISQPAFDIGKHAAEILITMIEKKKHITDHYKMVLSSSLNIRKSTTQ